MRDHRSETSPALEARGARVGLAVSRYHADVTDRLLAGAVAAWRAAGGADENLLVVPAPGSWELLPVARAMVDRGDLDGVVCLGLILTGETTHDRWLAHGLAGGLAALTERTGVPVAFGVLTCQDLEQARARAGGAAGNKGRESMESTVGAIAAVRRTGAVAAGGPLPGPPADLPEEAASASASAPAPAPAPTPGRGAAS